MAEYFNDLNQPVGEPLLDWKPVPVPSATTMEGRFCRLEKLDPAKHGSDLWHAFARDSGGANWTWLPYGPFDTETAFLQWLTPLADGSDPLFYTIIDLANDKAVGIASYLRINPDHGSIEVGHIHFSTLLQRRPHATEAMFLMMRQIFDLGYRRYEWKCNSLNAPSCQAALRFGFTFEGMFRQMLVIKGRNRDSNWYSILDSEWPAVKEAYEAWLSPDNFNEKGGQLARLSDFMPKTPDQ